MTRYSTKNIILKTVVLLVLCFDSAWAIKDKPRIVTKDTLPGIWEAVSDRDYRVFQLDVHENGEGLLVFTVPHQEGAYVYKLSNVEIEEEEGVAKLTLDFVSDHHSRIRLQGAGWVGCLKLKLDMNPSGAPNIWNLHFYKVPGNETYVELLSQLSRRASRVRKEEWEVTNGRRGNEYTVESDPNDS